MNSWSPGDNLEEWWEEKDDRNHQDIAICESELWTSKNAHSTSRRGSCLDEMFPDPLDPVKGEDTPDEHQKN